MKNHSVAFNHGGRLSFASKLTYSAAVMCTVLASAYATAQEASTGDSATKLEEIVVTAQRREQNLQDTPIAVSAFSAEELLAGGVSNIGDLAHVAPSLNIEHVVGIYIPYLRGIGNGAAGNVGNESSVPVYIDDVYYSRLSTAYLDLGSIDRVEVLNGPQGTLFGRNSSGGAIQMFTKEPGRKPELDATIGYANYDTVSGQLYASTPITDTLAWNFSFGGSDQSSGWGKSVTTGKDVNLGKDWTVRSKLLWAPGDGTRVEIAGYYAYSESDIGMPLDRHSGTWGGSAQLPLPGYPNPPIALQSLADVPGDHFYDTRDNLRSFAREEGYGGSIRIDQDIHFAQFVSITAFRDSKGLVRQDGDLSAQNFFNADLNDTDDQVTQEFQVKSKKGSKIDWIIGAYYLNTRDSYNPAQVYGDLLTVVVAPGAIENISSKQTIDSYSGYAQATAPVADKTNLTLGVRYTNDKVSGHGAESVTIPGVGTIPLGPDYNNSKTFDAVTWKGAIDHHFSDDMMAYASVSRGYKSGTFNMLPLDSPPAQPEKVDAYEVGLKSEFLDHRVRLNGALFLNEVKSPQVLTVITKGLSSAIGLTNAQKARVKGGEFGLQAIVASGLTLRGAATYLDGTYTEFTNAPFYSQNATTIIGPILGDATGNRLPNVAKWRFDVGANYAVNTGVGEWVGDLSASYTGRFAWNPDNLVWEKAVTLVNASLSLTPSSLQHVTITVWGKNLGNVKYYSSSQESAGSLGTGGFQTSAAAPLTFGGSLSVKF